MSRLTDWNVVVTTAELRYPDAKAWLTKFGTVGDTDYYNVLVMRVEDVQAFLETIREELATPPAPHWLGRILPLTITFRFQNPEQFEREACEAVQPWADRLRGKRFHVRMHRRGFRGRLLSQHEELFLDRFLLEQAADAQSQIDFEDPDVIIALETVGQQGGVSYWTREQRQRYPFLKLD